MKLFLYSGNLSTYYKSIALVEGKNSCMSLIMNGLYDIAFMDLGLKYPFALELLGFVQKLISILKQENEFTKNIPNIFTNFL